MAGLSKQNWLSVGRFCAWLLSLSVVVATGWGWLTIRDGGGVIEMREVDALVPLAEPVSRVDTPSVTTTTAVSPPNSSERGPVFGDVAPHGSGELRTVVPDSPSPDSTTPEATASTQHRPELSGGQTYLAVGIDSRYGEDSNAGAGTSDTVEGARTDAIMLAWVPDDPSSQIQVMSVPRDSGVARPECARWDERHGKYTGDRVPGQANAKINSTYAVGGPRCLVDTVQRLTGVKVDKYVSIDFVGLQRVVDAMGGLDVDAPYPLIDGELGPILPQAGPQHIDGQTALKFARARKVDEEGRSDYGRIARQQQLVQAASVRAASADDGLFSAMADAVRGDNITASELRELAKSALTRTVDYRTAPTMGTDDAGNEILDMSGVSNAVGAWK